MGWDGTRQVFCEAVACLFNVCRVEGCDCLPQLEPKKMLPVVDLEHLMQQQHHQIYAVNVISRDLTLIHSPNLLNP